jgi:hypothetical protein
MVVCGLQNLTSVASTDPILDCVSCPDSVRAVE